MIGRIFWTALACTMLAVLLYSWSQPARPPWEREVKDTIYLLAILGLSAQGIAAWRRRRAANG